MRQRQQQLLGQYSLQLQSAVQRPGLVARRADRFTGRLAICRDLLSWSLKQAANEDQPRFTSTLIDDANEASTTQLGNDMTSMENDLVKLRLAGAGAGPARDAERRPDGRF